MQKMREDLCIVVEGHIEIGKMQKISIKLLFSPINDTPSTTT